jgi:hypothetical protein
MADEQERPDEPRDVTPPAVDPPKAAKKAVKKAVKKAPQKAPAKKAPQKAPAKKAPPKKAAQKVAGKPADPPDPRVLKPPADPARQFGAISRPPGSNARVQVVVAVAMALLAILLIRRLLSGD